MRITWQQLLLTAAYAFTDFKAQGQSIDHIVRNHISVGMERAYLHKLSIDHLHYGVI
jgi:hypothetical protein